MNRFGFYFLPLFAMLVGLPPTLGDVREGMDESAVLAELGDPIGKIETELRTILLYPRGEVTLKEDRVVEAELLTGKELAAKRRERERARREWRERKEKRVEERSEQGKAVKREKLASRRFAALPAEDRLDYWRDFQDRYPQVDVSRQIADALERYEQEVRQLRARGRIAELESRVARAENEAARLRKKLEELRHEREAEKDRRNPYRKGSHSRFGFHRGRGSFTYPSSVTIISGSDPKRPHRGDPDFTSPEKSQAHKQHRFDEKNRSTAEDVARTLKKTHSGFSE